MNHFDLRDPHRFATVAFHSVGTHLRVLDAGTKIVNDLGNVK
jgi:hypothetical protein